MIRRTLGLVVFVLLLAGCSSSPKAPGSEGCSVPVLREGAVVSSAGGGGISGWFGSYVAFPDGRVELTEKQNAPRTIDVGKARIDRLVSDIRATGVTDEEEGCYVPDPEDRVADGMGGSLVMRDGAVVRGWSHADGGDPPDAVVRAASVAGAFLQELVEQK